MSWGCCRGFAWWAAVGAPCAGWGCRGFAWWEAVGASWTTSVGVLRLRSSWPTLPVGLPRGVRIACDHGLGVAAALARLQAVPGRTQRLCLEAELRPLEPLLRRLLPEARLAFGVPLPLRTVAAAEAEAHSSPSAAAARAAAFSISLPAAGRSTSRKKTAASSVSPPLDLALGGKRLAWRSSSAAAARGPPGGPGRCPRPGCGESRRRTTRK